MSDDPLKPWSVTPLVTAFLVLWVVFVSGISVFMLVASPSLKATAATKAIIVVLAASAIGGSISTLMWSRHWRRVQWQGGFWAFVSGPAPEYEEARRAWLWGRRFRLCWIVTMLSMAAIVLAEMLAGNW
jgi:hypothetical protein